ncbi:hypothetical protein XU42_26160, partial [Salmonella enterica]|nr:hypothetical protein [Salmonella enterica]
SAPIPISATTTVKYRSWDVAGNAEAVNSRLVTVDAAAPVTSILCNGNPCSANGYTTAPQVSFTSTDVNGLGVASTHYTTDGTDPTLSSPTYSQPFPVTTTTTVKFRSWDNAGNVEATQSQVVLVDGTPPVTTISCNGTACKSTGYTTAVSVTLSAADATGGSGLASTHYTTDGTDPT